MQVFCDAGVGYELAFGEDFNLLGAKQVKYVLRLEPALVKLLEFIAGYLAVSPHLQNS
jgi:hypothetical protein